MSYLALAQDKESQRQYRHLRWIYLGSEIGLQKVLANLEKKQRFYLGERFYSLTDRVRNNFIDFVGDLSQRQNDQVLWYASLLASKSTSQTNIFSLYVLIKMLAELAQENSEYLIVTDDIELYVNSRELLSNKIKTLSYCEDAKGKGLKERWKWRRNFYRVIAWILLCKIMFPVRGIKYDVLIHSWIDNRSVSKLPSYNDVYFGQLATILEEHGYEVGRMAPLTFPFLKARQLAKLFSNFVFPVAYLKLADLLKVGLMRFRIDIFENNDRNYADFEILSHLVNKEMEKEQRSGSYRYFLLCYYAYQRLNEYLETKTTVIYPFENQPWEKMLNLAWRDKNKIAYQHAIIPHNMLDYRKSKREVNDSYPRKILTNGRIWSSFLSEQFSDALVEDAGAIRFKHLFKEITPSSHKEKEKILLALPIYEEIAILLQRKLLEVLENGELAEIPVVIKPHPHLEKKVILKNEFARYPNCSFVDEAVETLFETSALLITSASAVGIEAVLSSVKTVYLIPEAISEGYEYYISKYLFLAYEQNFAEIIQKALKAQELPHADVEEYFSRPDYNVFLKYINN